MKKELIVTGMSCGHCVHALKTELTENNITVLEAGIGKAIVEVDETVKDERLIEVVKEAGYAVTEVKDLN